jgi:predicted RNA-binding protein YlqC (UPF0109 family)
MAALAAAGPVGSAVARDAPGILEVSMIQLIANPAEYHGKRVRVEGYLHDKFEDQSIYLSKEDADHLVGRNGLWVSYAPTVSMTGAFVGHDKVRATVRDRSYFDCRMVVVEGIFDKDGHGHLGMSAGEITSADRLLEVTRWFDGSREIVKPGN